jgi:hypothetical protein
MLHVWRACMVDGTKGETVEDEEEKVEEEAQD